MINATSGQGFVGAVTVYVTLDGGPQVIGSVGGGAAAAIGNGVYRYFPAAAETAATQVAAFTFIGIGAIPATVQYPIITAAQQAAVSTATGTGVVPVSQVCSDALTEIRIARAGDVIPAESMTFAFNKFLRLLDLWNADQRAPYAVGFPIFTPTPNLQPHTLGPTGTWTLAQAPIEIKAANLIINTSAGGVPVRMPIRIRDAAWWADQRVRGITSAFALDLYYSRGGPSEAQWPNGSVYLWPVITSTYQIELQLDGLFPSLLLTSAFYMPYGYRDAITLALAVSCCPGFGQTASKDLKDAAMEAKALVFGRNNLSPNLVTQDAGMPSSSHRSRYNYLTGFVE